VPAARRKESNRFTRGGKKPWGFQKGREQRESLAKIKKRVEGEITSAFLLGEGVSKCTRTEHRVEKKAVWKKKGPIWV